MTTGTGTVPSGPSRETRLAMAKRVRIASCSLAPPDSVCSGGVTDAARLNLQVVGERELHIRPEDGASQAGELLREGLRVPTPRLIPVTVQRLPQHAGGHGPALNGGQPVSGGLPRGGGLLQPFSGAGGLLDPPGQLREFPLGLRHGLLQGFQVRPGALPHLHGQVRVLLLQGALRLGDPGRRLLADPTRGIDVAFQFLSRGFVFGGAQCAAGAFGCGLIPLDLGAEPGQGRGCVPLPPGREGGVKSGDFIGGPVEGLGGGLDRTVSLLQVTTLRHVGLGQCRVQTRQFSTQRVDLRLPDQCVALAGQRRPLISAAAGLLVGGAHCLHIGTLQLLQQLSQVGLRGRDGVRVRRVRPVAGGVDGRDGTSHQRRADDRHPGSDDVPSASSTG